MLTSVSRIVWLLKSQLTVGCVVTVTPPPPGAPSRDQVGCSAAAGGTLYVWSLAANTSETALASQSHPTPGQTSFQAGTHLLTDPMAA